MTDTGNRNGAGRLGPEHGADAEMAAAKTFEPLLGNAEGRASTPPESRASAQSPALAPDDEDALAGRFGPAAETEAREAANDPRGLRERVADAADTAREQARSTLDEARQRASDTYEDMRDWASERYEVQSRRAAAMADRGYERVQQGRNATRDFVDETPLIVGVVGLAAGLLLGALLPRTRQEDRTIGPYADEMRDQGLRYAREMTQRGRAFVETALDPENLDTAARRASGDEDAPRYEGPERTAHRL